ncbi:MBL fold metallo-hydrolase [Actinophytocola sediminis]
MSAVTELVPDRLFRIGTTVPVQDLTWAPDLPGRWEPLNCYLLRTPTAAIFLDAGPAIMRQELEKAVAELVGDRAVWIFPTRNEFDCIGNLGYLLGLRDDARLLFGGGGGILEWVNDPAADEAESRTFLGRREIVLARNGTTTEFDDGVRFHWLDAPVKEMFLTQWVYEESTRTLFSSDFFGWSHLDSAHAPVVAKDPEDLPGRTAVLDELPRRVNWLPGASAPEVIEAYDRVADAYEVERIAPVHGRVLSGAATVARAFADTRSALADLTEMRHA